MCANQESRPTTFYNHIENVRCKAIDLTNGWTWQGAIDRADIFDNLDAARREYMRLSDKNEKLRKLVQSVFVLQHDPGLGSRTLYKWLDATMTEIYGKSFTEQARELGVEVD